MANLIIDIGNTAVKASWSDGMTLGRTFRYQGEKVSAYILSLTEKQHPDVMVISSVYPISRQDRDLFQSRCGDLLVLDSEHPEILKEKGLPTYLTYDRAASILAARYLFKGKGCTVFDLGTTLTVDFTNEDGSYSGGNISLGYRTRLKALNRYSRALPLIERPEDVETVGTDFTSSVGAGVVSGIMFEIGGYIALCPDHVIVFTGGDANFFANRMKNSIFVICNLVLMGLALIADEHVKKRN